MSLFRRRGSPFWWMRYVDTAGRLRRVSTKQKKIAKAETVYAEVIGAVKAGTYQAPSTEKRIPPPPIGTAIDSYIDDRTEIHGKQRDSYRYLESLWKAKLPKNRGVDSITTEQVERILAAWIGERSGSAYCRALAQLSGFLSWCKRKRWIRDHPIRGRFERPPEGKTRRGYLKRHWREPLLTECVALARERTPEADPQWLANVVRFAVNTGLRKSKLLGRTTAHLESDGDRVLIRVGRDKNGDAISLELFEDCKAVALARIEAARFAKKPVLLLPGPSGGRADSSVRRHLEAAVQRLAEKRPDLGIRWGTADDALTFHAFRRTFATEARRQGANLDEIKKLGNWRNSKMPEAYIQMEDERSAELLGKMARSFRTDTLAESEAPNDDAASG